MYRDLIWQNRNDFFLFFRHTGLKSGLHRLPKQREQNVISLTSLKAHFQASWKEFSNRAGSVSWICSAMQLFLVLIENSSQVHYGYHGHPWLMPRKASLWPMLPPAPLDQAEATRSTPHRNPGSGHTRHCFSSEFAASSFTISGHLARVTTWSQAPGQLLGGQKATRVPETWLDRSQQPILTSPAIPKEDRTSIYHQSITSAYFSHWWLACEMQTLALAWLWVHLVILTDWPAFHIEPCLAMETPTITSETHLQASEPPCVTQNNLSNFLSIPMNSKHTPEDVCMTIWFMTSAVSLMLAAWLLQGMGCQTPQTHWNKLLKISSENCIGNWACEMWTQAGKCPTASLWSSGCRDLGTVLVRKGKKNLQWWNKVSISTDKTCYLRTRSWVNYHWGLPKF